MKLLLCDDHRMVREGLRAMLERQGFQVVAEAADGDEALQRAHALSPDVVVMDVSLPDQNGINATRRLTVELPHIHVLALSVHTDRRYADAMFAAGALGYLPKSAGLAELVLALQTVASGHEYRSLSIGPSMAHSLLDKPSSPGAPVAAGKPLSPREREVLQLVASGKSSKEIAASLEIGAATVETHRRQLMDKLGLRTIAELTKYAIRAGLASID